MNKYSVLLLNINRLEKECAQAQMVPIRSTPEESRFREKATEFVRTNGEKIDDSEISVRKTVALLLAARRVYIKNGPCAIPLDVAAEMHNITGLSMTECMEMFSKKTGERDFLLRYACDGGDFYARSSIRGRTARLRYQKLGNLTQKIESQM
jgi:hypothetical protein